MSQTKQIIVKGVEINILQHKDKPESISLTDMAKGFEGEDQIKNWLRNKNTIEFLASWETLNNPDFNLVEFDQIRKEAGTNRFLMSAKQWISKTNAIGIIAKTGRYGGTYANKDIAYHFGMWLSPEFQLLIIKEFDRLKEQEAKYLNVEWDYRRFLSKVNYHLQTDAIKENIIPSKQIGKDQEWLIYAEEADILNYAVFGITAKQWRDQFPKRVLEGRNIRDYADIPQLTVLANLETYNSIMIKEGKSPKERLIRLRKEAVSQLTALSKKPYGVSIGSPFALMEEEQSKNEEKGDFDETLSEVLKVPPPPKRDKK